VCGVARHVWKNNIKARQRSLFDSEDEEESFFSCFFHTTTIIQPEASSLLCQMRRGYKSLRNISNHLNTSGKMHTLVSLEQNYMIVCLMLYIYYENQRIDYVVCTNIMNYDNIFCCTLLAVLIEA
jgi:hypothetical protein